MAHRIPTFRPPKPLPLFKPLPIGGAKPRTHAQKQRNSPAWVKFRRWYVAHFPLCADPFNWHRDEGRQVAAKQVHHIVALRDGGKLLSTSNCVSLCHACHGATSAKELRGEETASYFTPQQPQPPV